VLRVRHVAGRFSARVSDGHGRRPVDTFWDGERRFDVVLRLPLSERDDLEKIRKLRVPCEGGFTVPLEGLAHSRWPGPRVDQPRDGKRYIGIRMNVRGRDLGSFVNDARALVQHDAPMPAGIAIEWGGEFENKERAMNRLATVVPVALLLTLLLLFKAFDSFGRAVLTLLQRAVRAGGGRLRAVAGGPCRCRWRRRSASSR